MNRFARHSAVVRFCPLILAAMGAAWGWGAPAEGAESGRRPNLLVIIADDLGYSDLGSYGGEIQTPHLDRLAAAGLRYTRFYNTGRCWPTRSSLLTGYYPHSIRRDSVPGVPSGGRGVRPDWAPLVSVPLKEAGYRTYHTGKWHVDGMPLENGFDRSYHLQDQHRFFSPQVHWKDDQRLPPVEPESGFYATTALADHVLECMQEHQRDHADAPFFHYLAFAAPHFPLHALPEDIARYATTYDEGWNVVRERRWKRIRSLGLLAGELSAFMPEVGPPYDFPESIEQLGPGEVNRPLPWSELNNVQRQFQATKMAIHAAMIDRMDREIGRVLEELRRMNALDDTVIFFLSDNGGSAEIMVRGDGHDPSAPMGSWKSHLCLGPGWSTVANTPFRYHKTWVHEGGIATPLIVHWPAGIEARGEVRHTPGHVIDFWPTLLELAGIATEPNAPENPERKRPGQSLVPSFRIDSSTPRELWWEHEGNRGLRDGDWKISAAGTDGKWELYRLDLDRAETVDLSSRHPERVQAMSERWEQFTEEHRRMATELYE